MDGQMYISPCTCTLETMVWILSKGLYVSFTKWSSLGSSLNRKTPLCISNSNLSTMHVICLLGINLISQIVLDWIWVRVSAVFVPAMTTTTARSNRTSAAVPAIKKTWSDRNITYSRFFFLFEFSDKFDSLASGPLMYSCGIIYRHCRNRYSSLV